MGEELAPHEGVVALGVITRKVDVPRKRTSNQKEERILVHVEGDDVLEGDLTVLVHLNEVLDVDRDRGALVGVDQQRGKDRVEEEEIPCRRQWERNQWGDLGGESGIRDPVERKYLKRKASPQ